MRIRTTAALAAALFIGLTACSSGDGTAAGAAKPTSAPSAPAAHAAPTAPAAPTPGGSSAFLRPTPEQEKALVAGLTAIDPGLTVNKERAIGRSVSVCDDIRSGKDHATVVKNTASRYDGGNAKVDNAKAQLIVTVVKDAYCRA